MTVPTTPLFGAIPGGPEMLILLLLFFLFALFVPIAVAIWIHSDTKKRGHTHPVAWALATFFSGVGGIVVVLLYLVVRDDIGDAARQ